MSYQSDLSSLSIVRICFRTSTLYPIIIPPQGVLSKDMNRRIPISKKPLSVEHARELLRMVRLVSFKTGEFVTILPSLGGRVHEIVLKAGKRHFSILQSPH